MNQGKIVEYIDQGRLVCAVCLQDKGNRLHLLTSLNREVNLSAKRAVIISESAVKTLKPREELLENLRQTEETRIRIKGQINVKELWELIMDENESFEHKYLTQLIFGQDITDDHLSALVRALFENRLYFRMKDGRFLPNSEEKVNQIIRQREKDALKEKKLKHGSIWLSDVRLGKIPDDPPYKQDIIDLLVELVLYGKDAQDYKYGKELISRAGISGTKQTRDVLVKLGVWEEDENLDFIRSGVAISFTREQLDESSRLAGKEIDFQGREDLRDLPTLTIDGPLTRDFDDAVSLEIVDDILHLGIHIADVAAIINPHTILDQEAKDRASSIYFPRKQIPMIPTNLSQDTLSLKQGCDRPAISLLTHFDKGGNLLDYRLALSVIRVHHQLTYEQANKVIDGENLPALEIHTDTGKLEGFLKEMFQMAQLLRQKRIDQDALILSLPDIQVLFDSNSSVCLELVPQDTPSRMIIAEFMILYNWLAARFCRDNQIHILFRGQAEPNERFSVEESGYVYYVFKQRRKLSPLQINTIPGRHSGLGLDMYIQATSPIRRYLDLVAQRQISSFLQGIEPVFDGKKLEEIRLAVTPVLKSIQRFKQNRLRYWTLKFLSLHRSEKYMATVLDEIKNKYRIVLNNFLLVEQIKRQNGVIFNPGEKIFVKIKDVDPWDDLLRLEYIDG
ncbi:MAG TPA: hypothetical protein DDW42_03980 [Desulfobacteraceae bacterium]|nr:hypothetical protein [Desulfobacteraceae bacterium]